VERGERGGWSAVRPSPREEQSRCALSSREPRTWVAAVRESLSARRAQGERTEGGPVRRVCSSAAISLDGFIAGPKGEIDCIVADPEIRLRGALRLSGSPGLRRPGGHRPSAEGGPERGEGGLALRGRRDPPEPAGGGSRGPGPGGGGAGAPRGRCPPPRTSRARGAAAPRRPPGLLEDGHRPPRLRCGSRWEVTMRSGPGPSA
jgi:hypothetical protein